MSADMTSAGILAEYTAWEVREQDEDDPPSCAHCYVTISPCYDSEPTPFCDPCAQEAVDVLVAAARAKRPRKTQKAPHTP